LLAGGGGASLSEQRQRRVVCRKDAPGPFQQSEQIIPGLGNAWLLDPPGPSTGNKFVVARPVKVMDGG
jgi:hypothetical protein